MIVSLILLLVGALLLRAHLQLARRERAFSLLSGEAHDPAARFSTLEVLREASQKVLQPARKERFLMLAACSVTLLVTRNPLLCLLPPLLLPALRRFLHENRGRKKAFKKEGQVPELIDSLTQSLRSGLSLQQSLQVCMEDVESELGEELSELVGEIRTGGGLEESLLRAAERSSVPSLRLTFAVLGLLHGRGGDLPRVLDRMRDRVSEGLEARRELRMVTSQSRVSGYLVSALPLAFLSIQAVLNPSYLKPMLATPAGNLLALVALALNAAAFLVIRRLTEGG